MTSSRTSLAKQSESTIGLPATQVHRSAHQHAEGDAHPADHRSHQTDDRTRTVLRPTNHSAKTSNNITTPVAPAAASALARALKAS